MLKEHSAERSVTIVFERSGSFEHLPLVSPLWRLVVAHTRVSTKTGLQRERQGSKSENSVVLSLAIGFGGFIGRGLSYALLNALGLMMT